MSIAQMINWLLNSQTWSWGSRSYPFYC